MRMLLIAGAAALTLSTSAASADQSMAEAESFVTTIVAKKAAQIEGAAPYCDGAKRYTYMVNAMFKHSEAWEGVKMKYNGARSAEMQHHVEGCDYERLVGLMSSLREDIDTLDSMVAAQ